MHKTDVRSNAHHQKQQQSTVEQQLNDGEGRHQAEAVKSTLLASSEKNRTYSK